MKGPLVDIAATLFLLATVLLGGYLWLDWKKSQIEGGVSVIKQKQQAINKSLKDLEKSFENSVKTTNLEE
jgi:hypothetical protein